jgi:hypothetical protein
MVCAREDYDELRGVQAVGLMEVIEEPDVVRAVTLDTMRRQDPTFALDDQGQELISRLSSNYVALRLDARRLLGWDHRNLATTP